MVFILAMSEKEPQYCWEYWNCNIEVRKECSACTSDSGKDCWNVAGLYNYFPNCQAVKDKCKACWDCPWFKKLNPHFDKG